MERITFNAHIMGGKPCIRGMRITVGLILGLLAKGYNNAEILTIYPYLEAKDIEAALLLKTSSYFCHVEQSETSCAAFAAITTVRKA